MAEKGTPSNPEGTVASSSQKVRGKDRYIDLGVLGGFPIACIGEMTRYSKRLATTAEHCNIRRDTALTVVWLEGK